MHVLARKGLDVFTRRGCNTLSSSERQLSMTSGRVETVGMSGCGVECWWRAAVGEVVLAVSRVSWPCVAHQARV